jgi:hypothetical protein
MIDLAINGAKFIKINKQLMIYRLNPMSTTIRGHYDGRTALQKKWVKEKSLFIFYAVNYQILNFKIFF